MNGGGERDYSIILFQGNHTGKKDLKIAENENTMQFSSYL